MPDAPTIPTPPATPANSTAPASTPASDAPAASAVAGAPAASPAASAIVAPPAAPKTPAAPAVGSPAEPLKITNVVETKFKGDKSKADVAFREIFRKRFGDDATLPEGNLLDGAMSPEAFDAVYKTLSGRTPGAERVNMSVVEDRVAKLKIDTTDLYTKITKGDKVDDSVFRQLGEAVDDLDQVEKGRAYAELLASRVEAAKGKIHAAQQAAIAKVGGETYTAAIEWARTNLTVEQGKTFSAGFADPAKAEDTLMMLMGRYRASTPSGSAAETARSYGNSGGPAPYASAAEARKAAEAIRAAGGDPMYDKPHLARMHGVKW
jgi:predicted RNA-binding protein with PUA domain